MSSPSRSDVRTAVAEILPEAAVTSLEPIDAGKNAVYAVSLSDREAVLKVGTASPDRVRVEPEIMQFVRNRTSIPIPAVLGTADAVLEAPSYLLERVTGVTVPDRPADLGGALLGNICEEAGGHLAELHQASDFDTFGPLVADDEGLVPRDSGMVWPALLERVMEAKIDALGERFDAHRNALRRYAADAPAACQQLGSCTPVFTHMDFRPANLVFDPDERPVTRAVLDWAGAAAAPAAYEVAHAEALLTDWPDTDPDERAALHERFRSGYASDAASPTVPDVYRVDARLRLMKHLDMEVGNRDDETIDARIDHHLGSLSALGVF